MKQLALLFAVLIIVSCSSKYGDKPDVLLTKDELEDVLFEMAVVQAAENTSRTDSGKIIDTYTYIKNRFGYDSVAVVSSTLYYANDYKEFEKINNRVFDRIKVLKEKYAIEK